jgi:hypothetical protein
LDEEKVSDKEKVSGTYLTPFLPPYSAILQQLGVLGIVAISGSAKPLISRNMAKIAKIDWVEGAWQC